MNKCIFLAAFILFTPIAYSETIDQRELVDYYFAAAKTGEAEVLQAFLAADFPVNLRNAESYTALMMAAYYGQSEAVELLLEHGADPCLRDKRGHTAIMAALVKGEWGLVKKLYPKTCNEQQQGGKSLEEFAAVFGQSDRLQQLAQISR